MENEEQKIKNMNEKVSPEINQNSNNIDEEKNIKKEKIINNDIAQKENNFINIQKTSSKNKVINKYIDQLMLEKLKILYNNEKNNEEKLEKTKKSITNNDENSKNNNEDTKINNNNSQGDEIKYNKRMTIHIKDIRNKGNNIYNINEKNFQLKLDLKEYFKKMNIDQFSSKVNEQKRNDIIKFAMAKKEEEKNYDNDFYRKKKENQNIINETQIKNEIDNKKESSDKNVQQNIKEINKEENNKKLEQSTSQSFISSLNEIYNNKFNTINNNNDKYNDKKIKKLEKSKIEIFETKNKNITNIDNKKNKETKKNKDIKDKIESKENLDNKEIKENIVIKKNENEGSKDIKENDNIKENKIKDNEGNININEKENTEDNQLYINDDENIYLEQISNSVINENLDKFCEGIFLASFPTEKGKITPKSEILPADCGHGICSKLPAMEPEIIYKYPKEIENLEINNLAASMCYPNGIKLCYEQNEENIRTVKNYNVILTNQSGAIFFLYTFHFYLKMLNEKFCSLYDMNPIRYQLSTYQDELCAEFNDELEVDIVKNLDMYSKLNFQEYVYIPFCLGIISKYPYYHQMEKCLESIFLTIKNESKFINVNELIIHLTQAIPTPVKNSKVCFSLPYINKICEISYPYYEDILMFGNNPMIILEKLSIQNIICFLKLLLFEQKLLVIGEDMNIVSEIILNFLSLIYPFEWIHAHIPVMSLKMLKLLQSFLPFFNGMNISLYEEAKKILSKTGDDIFIINIDEDIIDINSNLRKKEKFIKGTTYITKNFPTLPKGLENVLLKELKLIKIELEKYKNYNIFDKLVINNRIRNIFLYFFEEILYDYNKYSYVIDNYPVFNAFSMINEKPSADKNFYTELTSTQIFQMFIQKTLIDEEGKLYIDGRIKEFLELQKQGNNTMQIINKQLESLHKNYLSFQKINKNYIIKPFLIQNYKNYEEEMKTQKKIISFKDIKEFIYSQNFNDENNNSANINKSRKNLKIIDKLFNLSNNDDPKSFDIFILPDNLIKNKTKNNSDENKDIYPNKIIRKTSKMKIISGEKGDTHEYRYSFYSTKSDISLNEEEQDSIKDNIKDIMKKVFKSQLKSDEIKSDQDLLLESVKNKFGIDFFVNIMSISNKKNQEIKIIEKESFDFLRYIIFNVLLNILNLEETDRNILLAMKLTKSCFYIKSFINKKETLLSDIIFSQLENYSPYQNKTFWQKWIEDEMTPEDLQIYDLLKKNREDNDIKNNKNYKMYLKHSYEIIDKLFGIMIKLKVSNFFIYSTYSELSREYIINEEQFDNLMKEMINGLELYQKLSRNNSIKHI